MFRCSVLFLAVTISLFTSVLEAAEGTTANPTSGSTYTLTSSIACGSSSLPVNAPPVIVNIVGVNIKDIEADHLSHFLDDDLIETTGLYSATPALIAPRRSCCSASPCEDLSACQKNWQQVPKPTGFWLHQRSFMVMVPCSARSRILCWLGSG